MSIVAPLVHSIPAFLQVECYAPTNLRTCHYDMSVETRSRCIRVVCSAAFFIAVSVMLMHVSSSHDHKFGLKDPHIMSADPDLDEALLRGGVQPGDKVQAYLKAIHIGTSGSIAVFFTDLVTRLKTGVTVAGTEYKFADNAVEDAVVAQCVVVTDVLRNKYTMAMTPASSSAPPTGTSTTSPATTTGTPALRFCRHVYTKLVNDYSKIQLDGEDRAFTEKMLLGADKALARMYHEHHISNHYTATPLGEIMS